MLYIILCKARYIKNARWQGNKKAALPERGRFLDNEGESYLCVRRMKRSCRAISVLKTPVKRVVTVVTFLW